jgi:hypothetical protein
VIIDGLITGDGDGWARLAELASFLPSLVVLGAFVWLIVWVTRAPKPGPVQPVRRCSNRPQGGARRTEESATDQHSAVVRPGRKVPT